MHIENIYSDIFGNLERVQHLQAENQVCSFTERVFYVLVNILCGKDENNVRKINWFT